MSATIAPLPNYVADGPDTRTTVVAGQPLGLFYPAPPDHRPDCTGPDRAFEVLGPHLQGADREICLAAAIDTRYRLLGVKVVSIGSVDHTFMAPREVYRDAMSAGAASIVVAHNHPSGNAEPSRDDESVTRRLVAAGELLGVALLDHLVVAGTRWTSLARRGVV